MTASGSLEQARVVWVMASRFPADKEAVYPEHVEAQEFDKHHGLRVLEYGCGGGSDAMSFLRRGNLVWYADIVPTNVRVASKRIEEAGLKGGTPLCLDENAVVPVEDGFFDLVSAHGVIHHIEAPVRVLREFYRVLGSGGLLYVMLYTEGLYAKYQQNRGIGGFGLFTDGPGVYARRYTEDEGRRLLEGAGFTVERALVFNGGDFRTFRARKP